MSKIITDADICKAANLLGCSTSAIMAVAKVESGARRGFDDQGRLLLRFEGHVFRKYTQGKYDRSYPAISYPYSRSKYRQHGYSAFNVAFKLNPNAALLSTSWGIFQIMGYNHQLCGYTSVDDMVTDYRNGENAQLFAFCGFIQRRNLVQYLMQPSLRNFARFANGYNGPSYADNAYDVKMWRSYKEFLTNPINCAAAIRVEEPEMYAEMQDLVDEIQDTEMINLDLSDVNDVAQPIAPVTESELAVPVVAEMGTTATQVPITSKVSPSSWIVTALTQISGYAMATWAMIKANLILTILGVILIAIGVWYLTKSKDRGVLKASLTNSLKDKL